MKFQFSSNSFDVCKAWNLGPAHNRLKKKKSWEWKWNRCVEKVKPPTSVKIQRDCSPVWFCHYSSIYLLCRQEFSKMLSCLAQKRLSVRSRNSGILLSLHLSWRIRRGCKRTKENRNKHSEAKGNHFEKTLPGDTRKLDNEVSNPDRSAKTKRKCILF